MTQIEKEDFSSDGLVKLTNYGPQWIPQKSLTPRLPLLARKNQKMYLDDIIGELVENFIIDNFTDLKIVIIARWDHRGLQNCYAYVVSYKNNSGKFVHKITFSREPITSPTNLYLTIGHEISHAVVAERNQNQ